jgi:hypothetical protein
MTRRTISLPEQLDKQIVDAAERTDDGNVSTWLAKAAEERLFRLSLRELRHEPLSVEDEAKLRAWLEWQNASAAAEGTDQQAA